MAHFTELGLSGSPDKKPEPKPLGNSTSEERLHSKPTKAAGKQKLAVLVGSLISSSLLGVFLLESACSKESDKTSAIVTPNQTAASQLSTPISTVPASTSTATASQPPAKKKPRQRKLSASTCTNPTYGVSFRYPKYGSLKEGDKATLNLDGLGPFEMNFIQPGGTSLSAVQLPSKLHAGTDFNAAFFNVSMNSKMTSEECEQFAFPETADPETDPVTVSKTKVGATEFHMVEGFAEAENNQADVKYYHAFQNGSCYEFALGLETAGETTPDEIKTAVKPVDRNEVFRQLNWILSTVKIHPVDLPAKTIPEVAADASTAPTNAAITEAH
jgi:hypothetical protein